MIFRLKADIMLVILHGLNSRKEHSIMGGLIKLALVVY